MPDLNVNNPLVLEGKNARTILFLPSLTAAEQNSGMLQDKRGGYLLNTMRHYGISLDDLIISYAIPKRLSNNGEPDEVFIKKNSEHVQKLILKYNPEKLAVIGESLATHFLNVTDFNRNNGFALYSPLYKRPCYLFGRMPTTTRGLSTFSLKFKNFKYFIYGTSLEFIQKNFVVCKTISEVEHYLSLIHKNADYITYDFETTSKDPMTCIPYGLGLRTKDITIYIPINKNLAVEAAYPNIFISDKSNQSNLFETEDIYVDYWNKIDSANIKSMLWDYIFSNDSIKVGHNAKYDYLVLYHYLKEWGINSTHDTMLMAHSVNSGKKYPLDSFLHTFPELVEYQVEVDKFHLAGKKVRKKNGKEGEGLNYSHIPTIVNGKYCCGDVWATYEIVPPLMKKVNASQNRRRLYNMYTNLGEIYAKAQNYGLRVDLDWHNNLKLKYKSQLKELSKQGISEYKIEIGSPAQVSEFLFGKLKAEPIKETKTGYSTDKDVLQYYLDEIALKDTLSDNDIEVKRFCESVLKYREMQKVYGTYIDGLSKHIYEDGKVHPKTNLNPARSARTSMSDPNLQNQIQRNDILREEIKGQFIPEPGNVLIECDWSRAEVCVAAYLSGDKTFMNFLREGDIYRNVGAWLYHCKPEEIDSETRDIVLKPVVLGNQYLAGARTLMLNINTKVKDNSKRITLSEAKEIQAQMRKLFPVFFTWRDQRVQTIEKTLKVSNFFDQYRYGDHTGALFNTIIQSTTSHFVQIGIEETYKNWLLDVEPNIFFNLNVHDAAYFQAPKDDADYTYTQFNYYCQQFLHSINLDIIKISKTIYPIRWGHK